MRVYLRSCAFSQRLPSARRERASGQWANQLGVDGLRILGIFAASPPPHLPIYITSTTKFSNIILSNIQNNKIRYFVSKSRDNLSNGINFVNMILET